MIVVLHRATWGVATWLVLVAVAAAQATAPTYRIEITDRQAIKAEITYEVYTKNFAVSRWMVYLPEPPELPSQIRLKIESDPKTVVVAEQSAVGRKVRRADIMLATPMPGAKLQLGLKVEATLRARRLVPIGPGSPIPRVAPLSANETKYYTSASNAIDFSKPSFQTWLDKKQLRMRPGEQPFDFAARVLEVIRSDFRYQFLIADKQASVVCEQSATDCSGMVYLFVAAMRANKVPARVLVGRLIQPGRDAQDPPDGQHNQPHMRAEFYAKGVGWVPVEPTNANGDKSRPVQDFVGDDPGDMLVMHIDVDLQLPYPGQLQTAQVLQIAPHYWAYGQGTFDGAIGPTRWELSSTSIEK